MCGETKHFVLLQERGVATCVGRLRNRGWKQTLTTATKINSTCVRGVIRVECLGSIHTCWFLSTRGLCIGSTLTGRGSATCVDSLETKYKGNSTVLGNNFYSRNSGFLTRTQEGEHKKFFFSKIFNSLCEQGTKC